MTDLEGRQIYLVVTQMAQTMPDSDDGWTTQPNMRFMGGSRGCGQVIGDAVLQQEYGNIMGETDTSLVYQGILPDTNGIFSGDVLDGQYVRILQYDQVGESVVDGNSGYSEFWRGYIDMDAVFPNGAPTQQFSAGQMQWICTGICGLLGQLKIGHGSVLSSDGSTIIDPGFMPVFNKYLFGDRSADQYSVNGSLCYVFDLNKPIGNPGEPGTGVQWSARDIIECLLVTVACGYDITWSITDPNGALSFIPPQQNFDGMSVLEAINRLVNMRRGLDWTGVVDGATITITPDSTSAVVIDGATFTLPAASNQQALTFIGNPFLKDPCFQRDYSNVADIIELRGAQPWIGITTAISDSWAQGWVGTGLINALRDTYSEYTQRRWIIAHDWNGEQWQSDNGVRNSLTVSGDDDPLFGWGGYTGERTFDDSFNYPAYALEFQKELPVGKLFFSSPIGPRQDPIFCAYTLGQATSGWDFTTKISVEVQSDPPALFFSEPQFWCGQDPNYNGQPATTDMLVTIGLLETQPLRVSWQRNPSDWPRDTPRLQIIPVPHYTQQVLLDGSVIGSDINGNLRIQDGDLVIIDHVPYMQDVLALMQPYYANPICEVSWTDRGIIDFSPTFAPGTLITSITTADGSPTTNALVTRQTWTYVPVEGEIGSPGFVPAHYDTHYTAQSIRPDVEAFR